MSENPLLQPSGYPYGAPAFDRIRLEHYGPAVGELIAQARKRVDEIARDPQPASFGNTVEALEFAGRDLESAVSLFFNLNSADTSPQMQELAQTLSEQLTRYSSDVMLNEALFERVKSVYEGRDALALTPEQSRLLEQTYKGFVRSGANLPEADKNRFREIATELSSLSLLFEQRVLAATNDFTLRIEREEELDGLPAFVREAAADEAAAKGVAGWLFTLQAQSMVPFMKYARRRDLREKLWRAYNSRCFGGERDNGEVIRKIVALRLEKARLLGFETYADFALGDRMARTSGEVNAFLQELLERSLPYARKELADLQRYAEAKGFEGAVMPWDFAFYSEQYKDEFLTLSDELLKPYFRLERVVEGLFGVAQRLYGIAFRQRKDIPGYHPDVTVYEVSDSDGTTLALFYTDFFPRESKQGGAWMTSYRDRAVRNGATEIPLVSIVCNFTKPTSTKPSLLTFGEVNTLFHEFGHALHGIFSTGTYPSLSGTNVARDFVELPSQIMENWSLDREFLSASAVHDQTGEPIPDDLVERIIRARNFQSGYASVRQLSFGINDMAWHTIRENEVIADLSVKAFEAAAMEPARLFPADQETAMSTAFSHIFAGGYAAGYYSYKWAEVLEADAFSLFEERGHYDTETARSFREHILSKGDREDAMTLFEAFRGREPQVDALFRKLSLDYPLESQPIR